MATAAIPQIQFQFRIPEGLDALWAARAIYTILPETRIELLPDRQFVYGCNHGTEAKALVRWLNREGLKGLEGLCKKMGVRQDESRTVTYISNGFVIKGNPNTSYGYLYIVAYRSHYGKPTDAPPV